MPDLSLDTDYLATMTTADQLIQYLEEVFPKEANAANANIARYLVRDALRAVADTLPLGELTSALSRIALQDHWLTTQLLPDDHPQLSAALLKSSRVGFQDEKVLASTRHESVLKTAHDVGYRFQCISDCNEVADTTPLDRRIDELVDQYRVYGTMTPEQKEAWLQNLQAIIKSPYDIDSHFLWDVIRNVNLSDALVIVAASERPLFHDAWRELFEFSKDVRVGLALSPREMTEGGYQVLAECGDLEVALALSANKSLGDLNGAAAPGVVITSTPDSLVR